YLLLFFLFSADHRALHSFPTRRSSDLTELLIEGAVGSLSAEQREVAGILRDNSLRLQRLIENLLSYSEWQTRRSELDLGEVRLQDRKSTRLNSSHVKISYAVFCLKKKK